VTEGPGFNVFCINDGGRVVTPDAGGLVGLTAKTVLEIAEQELGLSAERRPLPLGELMA